MFLGGNRPTYYPPSGGGSTSSYTPTKASGSVGTRLLPKWTEGTFPIPYGAKYNNKVVALQRALITRGALSPTAGNGSSNIDGEFGPLTADALRRAGFPNSASSVSQDVYTRIVSGGSGTSVTPTSTSTSSSGGMLSFFEKGAAVGAGLAPGSLINAFSGVSGINKYNL